MAEDDTFLDVMQADLVALLKCTPALADAVIIADNDGDLDSKVTGALKTRMDSATGKRGLVVLVLRPEVVEAETNLPGPPMEIKAVIQTIEQVMYNRDPVHGSLKTSSQAALSVLAALHLRHLGGHLLFSRKNPISTLPVVQGHLSRGITIYSKSDGFVMAKPAGVAAEMLAEVTGGKVTVAGSLTSVSGETSSAFVLPIEIPETGTLNGKVLYDGPGNSLTDSRAYYDSGRWNLRLQGNAPNLTTSWQAALGNEATPDLADWSNSTTANSAGTPQITVSAASAAALSLTCATPGASIRYTTDGSFPDPSKTLYSVPIPGLAAGTVVRAAAYVAGMPPSDVLELTITA